jgi:uncharacterized repeat protein (TIGR03803 family)
VAAGTAVGVVLSVASPDTVIYSFTDGSDGNSPYGGVIQASDGNFYGTTTWGGTANYGTVFMVSAAGVETVLHSFLGGSDGMNPEAGLVQGSDGDLYGVTMYGGRSGTGTVFKTSLTGDETVLYSFRGGKDGTYPHAALIQASDGNFYGTTILGGSANLGTVFKITTTGVEKVLHSFTGSPDGQYLYSGLTQGRNGDFYGTTDLGGAAGVGTVFKVTSTGSEAVLYSFLGGSEGGAPQGGLIQGTDGHFYGTTGGQGSAYFGTVFKITPAGIMTVLHVFEGIVDGGNPYSKLIEGSDGNFYGTSNYGPTTAGTIFRITPAGVLTELHAFGAGSDGVGPLYSGLTLGSDGNLYGTTALGGATGYGAVFQFNPPAE